MIASGFAGDVHCRAGVHMKSVSALLVGIALIPTTLFAQFQRDRDTMIAADIISATATELSGARAFNNVVEIAGFEHDRKADEYRGTYRESLVVERLAREYGFSNVRITRLPTPGPQWDGEAAELSVVAPEKRLVSRYLDHPAVLVRGSFGSDAGCAPRITTGWMWAGRSFSPMVRQARCMSWPSAGTAPSAWSRL
jgi:hypothetical protein